MGELLADLLQPETDRGVLAQWILAGIAWPLVLWRARGWAPEARQLVWGLALCTLAWFLLRMAH